MFLLLDTTQWPGKGKTVDPLETKPDSIWIRRANRVGGRLGPAPAILPIVATHDASNFPDLSRYKTVSFIANAQQRDHCVFKTRKVRKRPRTRSPDRLKVETRPTESVCCDNRVMVTYVFPYVAKSQKLRHSVYSAFLRSSVLVYPGFTKPRHFKET